MATDPNLILGGCLCGALRYAIKLPSNGVDSFAHDPHTCQCTQCRKHSGCLVATFITVHPSQLLLSATADGITSNAPFNDFSGPSLKEFASSDTVRRGFCSNCGSTMFWRDIAVPDELEIFVGTVDETYLIGDRTDRVNSEKLAKKGGWDEVVKEEKEKEKEGGSKGEITGGKIAGEGERRSHFFMRNAVAGVTDGMPGNKWVETTQRGLRWGD